MTSDYFSYSTWIVAIDSGGKGILVHIFDNAEEVLNFIYDDVIKQSDYIYINSGELEDIK